MKKADANPRVVIDILERLVWELKKEGSEAITTESLEASLAKMRKKYG